MGLDEAHQDVRSGVAPHTKEQTGNDLVLPQCEHRAVVDDAVRLLEEFPALALFRDREKNTWAITEDRLARFRQLLGVSAQPLSTTDNGTPAPGLFDTQRHYSTTTSATLRGCSIEVTGPLEKHDYLPALISPQLLRKIGFEEYAATIESNCTDGTSEEQEISAELILEQQFLDEVKVLCVRIKPPTGVEIDRSSSGEMLLSTCQELLGESQRAGRDKVAQRNTVNQLGVDQLHQPQYLDVRALTTRQPVVTFSHLNLSEFPLDWIKEGTPEEKRVILFEDSTQGFAVIRTEKCIFLHSDSSAMQAAIRVSEIDRRDNLPELFDIHFADFTALLSKNNDIKIQHLQQQVRHAGDSEEVKVVARAIISDNSELYVKSTRTSGGELIINVRPDEFSKPRILSDSAEVGYFLGKLARAADLLTNPGDKHPIHLQAAEQQLTCTESLADLLASLMNQMKAPIVERAIPAIRLKTESGDEKIEFRLILQGDKTLKVAGHYAKASLNDVAGNISIGGYGRRTRDAIARLYRQELGTRYHEERILGKIDQTLSQLISVAEDLGNKFAKSLKADKLEGKRGMKDFAVDICPVWNQEKDSIELHLLEIQYGYAYSGLTQVEPEMAKAVADFKASMDEQLRRKAEENEVRKRSKLMGQLFEDLLS